MDMAAFSVPAAGGVGSYGSAQPLARFTICQGMTQWYGQIAFSPAAERYVVFVFRQIWSKKRDPFARPQAKKMSGLRDCVHPVCTTITRNRVNNNTKGEILSA